MRGVWGQISGMLILWARGWGTEIKNFIFLEGWFRAGVSWGQTLEMIIL